MCCLTLHWFRWHLRRALTLQRACPSTKIPNMFVKHSALRAVCTQYDRRGIAGGRSDERQCTEPKPHPEAAQGQSSCKTCISVLDEITKTAFVRSFMLSCGASWDYDGEHGGDFFVEISTPQCSIFTPQCSIFTPECPIFTPDGLENKAQGRWKQPRLAAALVPGGSPEENNQAALQWSLQHAANRAAASWQKQAQSLLGQAQGQFFGGASSSSAGPPPAAADGPPPAAAEEPQR